MNEYEEIREAIDIYLMKRFKYRLSLVRLTPDNIVTTRRNSRIIARIGFKKERIGHGSHFVSFLAEIALKYGFKYIGIEFVNHKSRTFAEKLGFQSIDGSNYTVSVENLISYFQDKS